MSQKTNPLSLRLHKNGKSFSSSWYSDFFYNQQITYEISIREYIKCLFESTGHAEAFLSLSKAYRKSVIFSVVHDMRGVKREKELFFFLRLRAPRATADRTTPRSHLSGEKAGTGIEKCYKGKLKKVFPLYASNKTARSVFPQPCNNKVITVQQLKLLNSRVLQALHTYHPSRIFPDSTRTNVRKVPLYSSLKGRYSLDWVNVMFSHYGALCAQQSIFLKKSSQIEDRGTETSKVQKNLSFEKAGYIEEREHFFNSCFSLNAVLSNLSYKSSFSYKKGSTRVDDLKKIVTEQINLVKDQPIVSSTWQVKRENPFSLLNNKSTRVATHFTEFRTARVVSDIQNVDSLIAHLKMMIEKRVSFRQIKKKVFKEISHYGKIEGIRLAISGRLGGRGKKAQKAKSEKDYWGSTSLNTFSSNIAFAGADANTDYGKVGIKVWLAFKSK